MTTIHSAQRAREFAADSAGSGVRSALRVLRVDVAAAEPSPAYPAMFAAAFEHHDDPTLNLRVFAQRSHAAILDAVNKAESTLAVMSASRAARAIVSGLAGKIVCASVAPVDYCELHDEPAIQWNRDGGKDRWLPPRAVLVAPKRLLDHEPHRVQAAVESYWRAAVNAQADLLMLSVVLASELGLSSRSAEIEARRAVGGWRVEPAVRLQCLRSVLARLLEPEEHDLWSPAVFLDQRFVRAE